MGYKKAAEVMESAIIRGLNVLGNNVNKRIQDGLETGKDINGKAFKELKQSTKDERSRLGYDERPLIREGKMRGTKKDPATRSQMKFVISMTGKNRGSHYGAFHNEGYTTAAKSAWPGKRVPKRKWFGLPKEFVKGGKEMKKIKTQIARTIGSAFSTPGTVKKVVK